MSETNPPEPDERPEVEAPEPVDLSEETGAALDPSARMSSEALYIVREINALAELAEALGELGIELREEVAEGDSEVSEKQPAK